MSKRKVFVLGALGVVGTLITTLVAFVLFLGGLSGGGNETLLRWAMVVFSLPVVLPSIIGLFFGLFKVAAKISEERERFPGEVIAERTPREPLGFRVILKRIAIGASVIVLSAACLLAYEYVSRLEPSLVQAVMDHDVEKVRRLLDDGKDPNQRSHHGATALMTALGEYRPTNDVIALLLEYGADPDQPSHGAYQPHTDVNYRRTPVVVIATQRSELGPDALRLLIQHGADLNPARAHQSESSPVISALAFDNSELIEIMLAAGARLGARDERDVQMILQWAVANRNAGIVRLLIADDSDGRWVKSAASWAEFHRRDQGCDNFYHSLAALLREESSRRGWEQPYRDAPMGCV